MGGNPIHPGVESVDHIRIVVSFRGAAARTACDLFLGRGPGVIRAQTDRLIESDGQPFLTEPHAPEYPIRRRRSIAPRKRGGDAERGRMGDSPPIPSPRSGALDLFRRAGGL